MATRILMSDYSMRGLEDFIKSDMNVVVVPYSNYKHLKDEDNYLELFDYDHGREFLQIAEAYAQYDVPADNIVVVDPHRDDEEIIREKFADSHIIFLSGGCPEMFMRYCPDFVKELIINFDGIIMGSSAGAMVMQEWFYCYAGIDEYVGYTYTKGLGLAKGYNIMVHFVESEAQLLAEEVNMYTPVIRLPDGDNIVLVDKDWQKNKE